MPVACVIDQLQVSPVARAAPTGCAIGPANFSLRKCANETSARNAKGVRTCAETAQRDRGRRRARGA
eukprot:1500793-Pyramimonas_sp.AAC.1